MAQLPPFDTAAEVRRIESSYDTPHIRDVFRADWACFGRPEQECVRRTVQHFRALERAFDLVRPDVVVPSCFLPALNAGSSCEAAERSTSWTTHVT